MLLQIEIDSFAKNRGQGLTPAIKTKIGKPKPEKHLPVFTMTKPGLATITLFFAYFKIDFDLSTLAGPLVTQIL